MSRPETQEAWYMRKYKETGDSTYLTIMKQVCKKEEKPKDLSSFLIPDPA
ncbi:hypothetical protein [Vibrio phage vB_VhaP_PG11]|nr:hypothetical protein [Vibrio phage vB_VhaP_PG11]